MNNMILIDSIQIKKLLLETALSYKSNGKLDSEKFIASLNPTPTDDILNVLKDCANVYLCPVCGRTLYQHNTNCALDAAIKKLEGKI